MLLPRIADALGFIRRQIAPPDWIDESVLNIRRALDQSKLAVGLDAGAVGAAVEELVMLLDVAGGAVRFSRTSRKFNEVDSGERFIRKLHQARSEFERPQVDSRKADAIAAKC